MNGRAPSARRARARYAVARTFRRQSCLRMLRASSPRVFAADERGAENALDRSGSVSLNRIFVPVGSADRASAALAIAAQLSSASGGTVRILHVREFEPPPPGRGPFYFESGAEATAVVERAVREVSTAGSRASGDVVDAGRSFVARAIVLEAEGWQADAIVLAHQPRSPVLGFLLRSVADDVIRMTSHPVLMVGPSAR